MEIQYLEIYGDGETDSGNALDDDVDFAVLGKIPDLELGWTNQYNWFAVYLEL